MKGQVPDGVWPTMITPFTDEDSIDYGALEEMIEWYIKNKVDGLFAVCQSSEMFYLSLEERISLSRFVVEKVDGRIPVIASGHISNELGKQVEEMKRIADTGVNAAVLITNRFITNEEPDEAFITVLEKFLSIFPEDIPLGFYECPYPYKRLLSPELLKWCASTKRFLFIKDTSCDPVMISKKLDTIKGSGIKLYNANAATLLNSLKEGASGYCGVLANLFPGLFAWLVKNWESQPEKAIELQNFFGAVSAIEKRVYPVCAKHYLQLEGINIKLHSRMKNAIEYIQTPSFGIEIQQLHELAKSYSESLRQGRATFY